MTLLIIIYIIISILLISLSMYLGAYFEHTQTVISTFSGLLIGLMNFLSLAWAIKKIFQKKTIALAASVIVFKYAILSICIYSLFKNNYVDPIYFTVGFSNLFITIIIYALVNLYRNKGSNGSF